MTVTVSVGSAGGRDYSTIQAAWNALPSTLSDNYVFELYNDSEFTAGLSTPASAKTTGSYTVTIRPAAGEGFKDHPDSDTNALRYNQSNGVAISASVFSNGVFDIHAAGLVLEGLQIRNTYAGAGSAIDAEASVTVRGCILESNHNNKAVLYLVSFPTAITNNVVIQRSSASGSRGISSNSNGYVKGNVIVYGGSGTSSGVGVDIAWNSITASGNVVLGFATAFKKSSTNFGASSDYNATDAPVIGTALGSNNLVSLTAADQFEDVLVSAGSEDLRVIAGADLIGAWDLDTDVTTDIYGVTRDDPTTIGAWEYSVAVSAPTAPTIGTTTSITQTGATANWTDNSANETGFKVEYAVSPYSSWTAASGSPAAANATSLAVTGLSSGTTYKFRVAATNSGGDSSWVESATFTTLSVTKGVRIRLYDEATAQASLTGITALWWDGATPSTFGAPVFATAAATTDASGWLELDLDADTALSIGGTGFLLLYKAGATAADDLIFAGRLAVADIA